jgi:hypothetical protein
MHRRKRARGHPLPRVELFALHRKLRELRGGPLP